MNKLEKPIWVTQPTMPDLDDFIEKLKEIWESKWLTNNGKFHQEFEQRLVTHLGVKHVSLFTNGTLALVTALQALRITGEVITTPYSFVATTHALHWNGIKPVFCDIDPVYGNIDVNKIESLITPKTTAIVPVHVHGNPVDVENIEKIADTYGLKIVYDAAHAFGVKKDDHSILNFGDLSILSFHATKTFNTMEGGAIICHDEKTKKRIDFLKNFGFADEETVVAPGINAKMNEVVAAFGILQLESIKEQIEKRKKISSEYHSLLRGVRGIDLLEDMDGVGHNYAYFPIYIRQNYPMDRDELYYKLKKNNIYGRRYFYPLISDFPTYRGLPSAQHDNLPNAVKLSNEVICLPIYPDLELEVVNQITKLIKD